MDVQPPIESMTPEYLGSTSMAWDLDAPQARSKQRAAAPLAVMAAVVAIIGTCVAVVGHHKSEPVSNASLLRLMRSAASELAHSPSSTFSMTMTISAQGQHRTLDMSGVSSTSNHESSFTMTGLGVHESAIDVGGVSYIKIPSLRAALGGKNWLAVHTAKPTPELRQLASSGPAGLLDGLATVKGTVEDEGTEQVQGIETTEYRLKLNALKLFGSTFSQLFGSAAISTLKKEGFETLPMTVWLDKQGLPRKVELDLRIRGVSLQEVAYTTPSDTKVDLKAPPASDVRMVRSLKQFGELLRQSVKAT